MGWRKGNRKGIFYTAIPSAYHADNSRPFCKLSLMLSCDVTNRLLPCGNMDL